jgi:glutathione S-transferase
MKLYTFDPAPNPSRLKLFMDYKGIHIETQQVDLTSGEQLSESFLAVNPLGTVPALVLEDGSLLTEVIGICALLEEVYPERPLLGVTPLEKAQVLSADHEIFLSGLMPIADMLRNSRSAFADRAMPGPLNVPQIEALVERGKRRLDHFWQTMDAILSRRDWLVGAGLSLADIDLLVTTRFAGWVKESVPADCDNLLAWRARTESALAG